MSKGKQLISYIILTQAQTVDILVDKIFLNYNGKKNNFPDSKGKLFGMSLLGIYCIYLEFASIS